MEVPSSRQSTINGLQMEVYRLFIAKKSWGNMENMGESSINVSLWGKSSINGEFPIAMLRTVGLSNPKTGLFVDYYSPSMFG